MPDRTVQIAVPRPLHAVYDYAVPEASPLPEVGARVRVPFGNTNVIGICTSNSVDSPHPKLKAVTEVLDYGSAIPEELIDLAKWMSGYYHHPMGEVFATVLPVAARKGASFEIDPPDSWAATHIEFDNKRAHAQRSLLDYIRENGPTAGADLVEAGYRRETLRKLVASGHIEAALPESTHTAEQPPQPSKAQADAIEAIKSAIGRYHAYLLEGVTGSGKTEVYLRAMEPVIAAGGQVLVLVPEIALTPQTLKRFQNRYASVGMMHSNLTDHERLQTWLKCRAGEISVLIGTRSAVFTAFSKLGLIIVDEEHDSSYKQTDGLRYSARDLAAKRASALSIPVVFGSATPALETIHNSDRGRYTRLELPSRAAGASMPTYHVIDTRGQSLRDGISNELHHVIRKHLDNRGQVLLFLNRRGFSPALLCTSCGWQAMCPECDARLTLHKQPRQLMCHHCGLRLEVPEACDECGHLGLIPVGLGTQRTEDAVAQRFTDVPVYRIDRDTVRSNAQLEARFDKINTGAPAIMVGTQMLAKGHHFPNVTLVAVLNADAGFLSGDFRAPERTAQLIVQVAGRAGRAERPGEVWIQTWQPQNPLLNRLIEKGYRGFAELELAERRKMGLPPARPMAMLRAESSNPGEALELLGKLKSQSSNLECMGPVPAPVARIANRSRFQLMLLADNRSVLHTALARLSPGKIPRTLRWSIDVDPYDSL